MRSLLLLLPLVLLAACNPQLDIPDICKSGQVTVRGVAGGQRQTFTAQYAGPVDTSELSSLGSNVDVHASIRTVTFTAGTGLTSFDFVDALHASLEGPQGSGLPALEVAGYERTSGQAPSTTLTLQGNDADVIPYIKDGHLSATASFTGVPPTHDTTLGIEVCAKVSAAYHF